MQDSFAVEQGRRCNCFLLNIRDKTLENKVAYYKYRLPLERFGVLSCTSIVIRFHLYDAIFMSRQGTTIVNTHCPVFKVNEPRCTLTPKSSLQVMFGLLQMLLGRKMYAYTFMAQFHSTLDIYSKGTRTFTCTLCPPHNPRAEAITAIGLAATSAAVDGRTPSQTRQLPSLDPIVVFHRL
jgi:hypothetical protein